ncbi:MAG: twin-arginine translocase subunit TatC [Deltaproteobacteria bacterium]|nr:twin-arginine translocase subunit TatC [Deltaproteobacteria bacterium]
MTEEAKQPFMSHLEELRKRLINAFIAIGVAFCCAYYFAEELFGFLIAPLTKAMPEGSSLIFTNLPEMFFIYLKTAFVAGILVASPVIFYQFWKFIAPGLYPNEKRYVVPFVTSSTILFISGAMFGYFVVFPFGFQFFLGFANENLRAMPSVQQYFGFASKMLLAFGLVFELPVLMFFMSKMGLVSVASMKKKRKYAILMAFVVSAILTPPDVVTQCMMAVPLVLLYEVGIFFSRFARPDKKEEVKEKEEE